MEIMTTPPATTGPAAVRGPRLACLLRWYPAPSETFIHDELIALKEAGLAPAVWTLYGRHRSPPSPAMDDRPLAVERLGWRALPLD